MNNHFIDFSFFWIQTYYVLETIESADKRLSTLRSDWS